MKSDSCLHDRIISKGTVSALRGVYTKLLSSAERFGFGSDDLFAIQLASEEAIVNAVRHGNGGDISKDIIVEYDLRADKFELWVTDQGGGFEPDRLADPRSGDNIYKPGGRGVLLIKSYMDEVDYNSRGNSIHMTKYRSDARKNDE